MEDEEVYKNAILKGLVIRALIEFSQNCENASVCETVKFVNDFVNKYYPDEMTMEVKK